MQNRASFASPSVTSFSVAEHVILVTRGPRVSAYLVRHLDRGFTLVTGMMVSFSSPAQAFPLLAACILMFFVALGVLLSWEKSNWVMILCESVGDFAVIFGQQFFPPPKLIRLGQAANSLCGRCQSKNEGLREGAGNAGLVYKRRLLASSMVAGLVPPAA